jgi:hypothetical protein
VELIASAAHRAASWHAPPSPLRLAIPQGICVRPQHLIDTETIVIGDMIYFAPSGDRRVDGLRITSGIARILLLRTGAAHIEEDVYRLTVELLVPAWILHGTLADLEETHVWAPRDLIRDRWRTVVLGLGAVA